MGSTTIILILAVVGALVGFMVRPIVAREDAALPSWPVAEIVMAGLFALIAWRLGGSWRVAPVLVYASALFALSVVDLRNYLLPNSIMYPATLLCGAMLIVGELVDGTTDAIWRLLLGSVVYFVAMFIFHIVYPVGLGYGDVKLARLLGMFIGWAASSIAETFVGVLWALFLGSLLGTVVGLALLVVRKLGINAMPDPLGGKRAQSNFPFGPPLAVAGLILVLWPATFAA